MKQIRKELIQEGKIAHHLGQADNKTNQSIVHMVEKLEMMSDIIEELFDRSEQMEKHMMGLYESLQNMEQKLVTVIHKSIPSSDVHQMFDEIRKKQDQLKMELRNVHFTQRLTSATRNQNLVPRRERKMRFLGIF
jgi:Na+/phosphate symporter